MAGCGNPARIRRATSEIVTGFPNWIADAKIVTRVGRWRRVARAKVARLGRRRRIARVADAHIVAGVGGFDFVENLGVN